MIHWSRRMLKVKDGQLACCYETFLIMKSCYSRDKQVFTLICFKVPNLHSTQSQFIWNRFGIFLPVSIFKHKLWLRLKNVLNFHSISIFQIIKQTVDDTNENNGYFFISPTWICIITKSFCNTNKYLSNIKVPEYHFQNTRTRSNSQLLTDLMTFHVHLQWPRFVNEKLLGWILMKDNERKLW